MKWQCALLQRWLPEYPDGDLPAFWQRRLKSHLEHCPACRQELAALREVVAAIKAAPVTEPSPEFWTEFSRELHLKLAQVSHEIQAAPEAPRPWWGKLPYILGAPALAILALWLVTYFTNPERPALAPQPQVATQEAPPKALEPPKVAEAGRAPAAPKVAATPGPKEPRPRQWPSSPRVRPRNPFPTPPWKTTAWRRKMISTFPVGIWIRSWPG